MDYWKVRFRLSPVLLSYTDYVYTKIPPRNQSDSDPPSGEEISCIPRVGGSIPCTREEIQREIQFNKITVNNFCIFQIYIDPNYKPGISFQEEAGKNSVYTPKRISYCCEPTT
jgi:hypothetical protein